MNKIGYIIRREYLVRVRKRTFWILTFLLPFLYAALIGFSVYVQTSVKAEMQTVTVVDKSGLFSDAFEETDEVKFQKAEEGQEDKLLQFLKEQEAAHVLIIPDIDINDPKGIQLFSSTKSSAVVQKVSKRMINERIRDLRIAEMNLEKEVVQRLDVNVSIDYKRLLEESFQKDNSDVATGLSFLGGFLNYFFIFIYGSLVLRGVHEEKNSRIVEIIVSTVRPFELMFGKIVGVAMVGLTQFLLWVFFITLLTLGGQSLPALSDPAMKEGVGAVFSAIASINMTKFVLIFIFYFIGGYLLYSSLFASIAAAVDNQSDMQQFMFPLTIPLIIAIVSLQAIATAPNSAFSFWMSIIPLTAPVSMVGRIAFEPPAWELALSMVLLIAGFVFTTWIASKIYRIGILMYGSKVSYKELWKWMFYK